jgi:hypothetical protein
MLSNSKLNVTATLDTLLNASKNWEQNSRKTSNDTLYAILADCLRFYEDLLADVKARKKLNSALAEANITVTAGTDLTTKIARYVFRTEAKRAYVYARVLSVAHEQKIEPVNFVNWVNAHDGIDAISKKPKNGVTFKQQKASDKDFAEIALAKLQPTAEPLKLPADYTPSTKSAHAFTAAILRHERDGSISIVYGVNNEAIVSTMLAFAGRTLRKSVEEQQKKTVAQQQAAAIEAITREAIAQLRGEAQPAAA